MSNEVVRISDAEDLIPTRLYPYAKFPFPHFNPVQSGLFHYYDQDINMTIAASTSAGKTVCSEMFLAHEIRKRGGKGMFIAPLKALAQEKIDDWTDPNHHFHDLNLSICTGDYILTEARKKELQEANLILMTSEMLASRVRNFQSEKNNWLKDVQTIIYDESHLITVPGRGDHLEVGLMKLTEINPNLRVIFLSATLPNVDQVCRWLSKLTNKTTYFLESKYRPCPLKVHYVPYEKYKQDYDSTELSKIHTAELLIEKHPDDKFLVFTHTKRTGDLAKKRFQQKGWSCEFHNADLSKEDRLRFEAEFKKPLVDGGMRVLVATSTIAWGCCAPDTLIQMGDGTVKQIQYVKNGDLVVGWDANLGVNKYEEVVANKCVKVDIAFRLVLENGQECTVSSNHLFYGKSGYINVCDLKEGDEVGTSDGDFVWKKVAKIEDAEPGYFFDIEVAVCNSYISNGIISHNCNLPARRVILLGLHRGITLVPTYDIAQEIGRAGRPKYDPAGDAYILLPNNRREFDELKRHCETPTIIESQLLSFVGNADDGIRHYKVLAFHAISEIHRGGIKNRKGFHAWFRRSFANFQANDLTNEIIDNVVTLLTRCGAIKEENGEFNIASVGTIASMLYYSPFDVSDFKKNFQNLFVKKLDHNDYAIAMALANIDSNRFGIVSKVEREEIDQFARALTPIFGPQAFTDSAIKAGYCYYSLLHGRFNPALNSAIQTAKADFDRTAQVLLLVDQMASKWHRKQWFYHLKTRIKYGVKSHLVGLCGLPGVGAVRSQNLYDAGFKSASDIMKNPEKVAEVLKMKGARLEAVMEAVKKQNKEISG